MAKKQSNEKSTGTRYEVEDAAFVKAWIVSSNLDECGKRLGIPAHVCSRKATALRRYGVDLPQKRRGAARVVDVEGLNKLIK